MCGCLVFPVVRQALQRGSGRKFRAPGPSLLAVDDTQRIGGLHALNRSQTSTDEASTSTVVLPMLRQEDEAARRLVSEIDAGVRLCCWRHRKVPTMAELVEPDPATGSPWLKRFTEPPVDPWGQPYEIARGPGPGQWRVISHGPDCRAGARDDIQVNSEARLCR